MFEASNTLYKYTKNIFTINILNLQYSEKMISFSK